MGREVKPLQFHPEIAVQREQMKQQKEIQGTFGERLLANIGQQILATAGSIGVEATKYYGFGGEERVAAQQQQAQAYSLQAKAASDYNTAKLALETAAESDRAAKHKAVMDAEAKIMDAWEAGELGDRGFTTPSGIRVTTPPKVTKATIPSHIQGQISRMEKEAKVMHARFEAISDPNAEGFQPNETLREKEQKKLIKSFTNLSIDYMGAWNKAGEPNPPPLFRVGSVDVKRISTRKATEPIVNPNDPKDRLVIDAVLQEHFNDAADANAQSIPFHNFGEIFITGDSVMDPATREWWPEYISLREEDDGKFETLLGVIGEAAGIERGDDRNTQIIKAYVYIQRQTENKKSARETTIHSGLLGRAADRLLNVLGGGGP